MTGVLRPTVRPPSPVAAIAPLKILQERVASKTDCSSAAAHASPANAIATAAIDVHNHSNGASNEIDRDTIASAFAIADSDSTDVSHYNSHSAYNDIDIASATEISSDLLSDLTNFTDFPDAVAVTTDIPASQAIMSEEINASRTCIPGFYRNKTLFITGVTGFMGKVLLEKLLRSCPEIRRCYALVRPKKGQSPDERMEAVLNSKLFDKIRGTMPDLKSRVVPVVGDILEPNLGLSPEDEEKLLAEVNIVFHSAATVKFDDELRFSVKMNVIGVRMIVQMAKRIKHLEVLVHVSTAYANCDKESVHEMVYETPLHPSKLIDAVEWMDTEAIEALTSKLIGDRPNTYTYTKAMAECLLIEESGDLPVAIVRPSIVGASHQEPVPGWVDNLNGPSGLLAAVGKGLLFCMHGNRYCTADVIPVDIATNAMIAVAWHTATEKPKEKLVYNCTTGQINRFTWGQLEKMVGDYFLKHPCTDVARVPNPNFTNSLFMKDCRWFLEQVMPAYLMDFFRRLMGKKPMFVRIQDRLCKAVSTLEFFTVNEWQFHNDNIFMLLSRMSHEDKQNFCFDPRSINWKEYMNNYCAGIKQHVLKEDMSDPTKAQRGLLRLQRIQFALKIIAVVVAWRLLVKRVPVLHSLWNLLLGWVQFLFVKVPRLARSS